MNPILNPLLTCFIFICNAPLSAQWQPQPTSTTADFRGLCAVNDQVAWASGTKGTVCRTTDGGKSWQAGAVPDADRLDFRDIHAFSENTAYVLSIGPGENSRIYKTIDGGKTWKQQFKNSDPNAFYDAIAFWDENYGIALSDPVKGRFQIITTNDGGATWKTPIGITMPEALPGEGAFAASGTCLITHGQKDAWFVTGGAKTARIFHTVNRGQNWTVIDSPIAAGKDSAGIFSIAFRDKANGIIVGGDYRKPTETGATAAFTTDGGKTWNLLDNKLPFQSAGAWTGDRWITAGTSGSYQSLDQGATWKKLDGENYNALSFTKSGTGWAAGPRCRIARREK